MSERDVSYPQAKWIRHTTSQGTHWQKGNKTNQFLAVVADGWFLEGVDEEGMRDLGATEEGAVYPQRPTTPGGLYRGTV